MEQLIAPNRAFFKYAPQFQLRPYQLESIQAVRAKFCEGFRSVLVMLPTGAGKTIIFGGILRRILQAHPAWRALVIAHREELIFQACQKIKVMTGLEAAIDMAGLRSTGDEAIVVASVQTLARGRELPGDPFDILIIDEAHHAAASSYLGIIERFKPCFTLGFTATPYRADKKALSGIFEDQAYSISILELIRLGFLADIVVRALPIRIGLDGVRIRQGDFAEADLGEVLLPRLDALADIVARDHADLKLLTFCPLRNVSRTWAERLAARGLRAAHVDGDSKDREGLLAAFSAGHISHLSNASLLTEGYDEPSIEAILILRPTKSRGLFSQMIGRGTRIHPGKPHLLVLDPMFQCERHDVIGVPHLAAETDEQARQIQAQLDGGLGFADAFDEAEREVERQRRSSLEDALRAKAQRDAYVRKLAELALDLDVPEIAEFEPVFPWQAERPSEKQFATLEKCGVPLETIRFKGQASLVIDRIVKRRELGLATFKQVAYARRLGHPKPELLTFDAASNFISQRRGV